MEDMPKHPRLAKRGSVYWHRAAIPADIKSSYPKSEETFSLKTRDPREALVLVRRAAAEADARFAAHRLKRQNETVEAALTELSPEQLRQIEEAYFAHLLDEDEQVRLDGFWSPEDAEPPLPLKSFEDYGEDAESFGEDARFGLARGKVDAFILSEMKEVLGWEGIGLKLAPNSPGWKPVARAIQKAIVRAQDAFASRNRGDVVDTPEMPTAGRAPSVPLASAVRVEWIADKSRDAWVAKTKHEHAVWSARFLELVGDRPIDTYTKTDGRAFKQALQRLPANWTKQKALRGLNLLEAAEHSASLGLMPMSAKNANKLMNFVRSFWKWAADHYDEVTGDPLKGLQIPIKQRARDERSPFTLEQLRAIFAAPVYLGCRSERKWTQAGPLIQRESGKFWVPIISLFSGARLGEIVQLRTQDVQEARGIQFFDLLDEGKDQRLKNVNARRRIPVHPKLIELGFGDFLAKRRQESSDRLFPDLPIGKDGYYSSPFSKYFGRFLRNRKVKTPKTSFHSFRHNFEDACREAGIPGEVMNALQGHAEEGMADRYGGGFAALVHTLDGHIRNVTYPDLDLSGLMLSR